MEATPTLLKIAGCENASRQADVIFVHGLDGDARSTWHLQDKPTHFWSAWLGEDCPQFGVWSLGYAVSASAWKGHSMPLYDRADNTLDLLDLDGMGQRPLAFVCHSLGGLLIKQALRNAIDAHNPHWQAIARQSRLMVFLSTPHSGASMASWIQYLGKLLRTTVSVEELEAHHPRLRELNTWYRNHVGALGIQTFVYYEKLPTAGILVVDATTADPGIPGVSPIPVDEDHRSICKPASKEAQIYRRVKRLLEDTVLHPESGNTPDSAPDTSTPRAAGGAGIHWPDRPAGVCPALPPVNPSPPAPVATGLRIEAHRRYYQECVTRWSHVRYALDKRFVHLTLLVDRGEDGHGPRWQPGSEMFHDLGEVLAHVPEQAVVVLGPPGSGKSTLLRHFELDCARVTLAEQAGHDLRQAPLTFFVPLNDFKPARDTHRLPLPQDWLAAQWATRARDLPAFETVLQERRLTLLLDALNEMPAAGTEPVQLWRDFLGELEQTYPGNRVVFSCRTLDYSVLLSSRERPVRQVRIESLSDAQVEEFIMLYCPDHGAALWQNLKDTPQLDLLRSPYYLKLLVAQTTTGDIPVGRAALFTGFVRQALQREVQGGGRLFQPGALVHQRDAERLSTARTWPPFALPESGPLLPKLSALAWQMQTRSLVTEASQVRIAYDEALQMLDHPDAEDILKAGGALGVLDEDRGRDEVLYVHQLLQEYSAARLLARQPQPALVQQEWRVAHVVPDLSSTLRDLADADPLPPLPSTGWEETTVLAAAMASDPERFITDLMAPNLALAGRCAAQPEVRVSEGLKDKVRWALVGRTQDSSADLRARIVAGLALGELGDPRFERRHGPYGVYLLPPLINIPGGTYHLGSDEGFYEGEAPVHGVELTPFTIAEFPLTNAEWALFMQADGYEDERWWETEEARAWRRGEGTTEGAKQQWRNNRKYFQDNFNSVRQWPQQGRMTSQQVDDWEGVARMRDDEFEALLAAWYPPGRQAQPAYWHDDAFNHSAQPVVGVCWFEARAYCAWLSAQTGETFRLPTEAEWEAAARGVQCRRYAFGDDFYAARCNTFETHVRHTTPISVFPSGRTPEGLMDMTGNTWDWTSSLYTPYPYDVADGREAPSPSGARRVVRGGSWDFNLVLARASFRNAFAPDLRHFNLGLRVVRSSPGLGSGTVHWGPR